MCVKTFIKFAPNVLRATPLVGTAPTGMEEAAKRLLPEEGWKNSREKKDSIYVLRALGFRTRSEPCRRNMSSSIELHGRLIQSTTIP